MGTALNTSDWDPNISFVNAKNLTAAVEQTRKIIRSRGGSSQIQTFPVDTVLAALAAGEQRPQAAAALLLGLPEPERPQQPQALQARPGGPPHRPMDKRGQVAH